MTEVPEEIEPQMDADGHGFSERGSTAVISNPCSSGLIQQSVRRRLNR
jgi:hypothetical protein